MGACDLQGWHAHQRSTTTEDTSGLRGYFGSSPAIVVGGRAQHWELTPLGVPCHRAMSYFGLCSTGEGPFPRLSSACKHHHIIHTHPPSTINHHHHL